MTTIEIILASILLISMYGNYSLLKLTERLEDEIDKLDVDAGRKLNLTKQRINTALSKMRDLDYNGAFESDDEVGSVFKELKNCIEELK